jgi:peptidoglycan/xylan/chitin deacetylase (PgdA/CDA1 family)
MSRSATPSAGWGDLREELGQWLDGGRHADLWWRDDDAVAPSEALRRLVALARHGDCPLALAVVPAAAEDELASLVEGAPIAVLQHGYSHRNYAPAPAKKAELWAGRDRAVVAAELALGRQRLAALFGVRSLAVMVPPWNRYERALLPVLGGLGFIGLSAFGPRAAPYAATEILQVNVHVDLIDWHGGRGFAGEAPVLGALVDHLRRRRLEGVEGGETTGILTHHGVHDEAAWSFLARLLDHLAGHPAARIVGAADLFAGC